MESEGVLFLPTDSLSFMATDMPREMLREASLLTKKEACGCMSLSRGRSRMSRANVVLN